MKIIDEDALRALIADEVRRVVREEVGRAADRGEYLSVARAAETAEVTPGTIRSWIQQGRLTRFHAGRELRVLRSELTSLLARQPQSARVEEPEQAAVRYLNRKREEAG